MIKGYDDASNLIETGTLVTDKLDQSVILAGTVLED